jgi:tRNA (cmo5U34)-methyltransferase
MTYAADTGKSSLGHLPANDRWTFDESVTDVFNDMLRRSIPQYDIMRQSVFDVASPFVRPDTQIVDLGCARGEALAPFIAAHGARNRYVGIDVSAPMLQAARERFTAEVTAGLVTLTSLDLRTSYFDGDACLTLCILTLQFTPIEYRQHILQNIFRNTIPGGAVVLVEKVLGASAGLGQLMIRLYHQHKTGNGYSADEIERKRLALEGVLVPVTARWNEDMLHTAGFTEIDCFWRWMNFAGWIAVKGH